MLLEYKQPRAQLSTTLLPHTAPPLWHLPKSLLNRLPPHLPNILTRPSLTPPVLLPLLPLLIVLGNHIPPLPFVVALRPHAEPERIPVLTARLERAEAVNVVELAAQGSAVEGAVEEGAAVHCPGSEGGGGDVKLATGEVGGWRRGLGYGRLGRGGVERRGQSGG